MEKKEFMEEIELPEGAEAKIDHGIVFMKGPKGENSKPLANQKVLMETMNGTKAELASDAQGVITVRIPDDFKVEAPQAASGHNHGRRSSDIVLATEYAEGGKTYLTAFNASYGTDAFYQRDLLMGLGFTLLGMIGAAPLLRQRKDRKTAVEPAQNKEA